MQAATPTTHTTTQAVDSGSASGNTGPNMRAIAQHAYGSSEQLKLAILPRPKIRPNQVLIEVVAAGLDRGVWHLMTGLPYLIRVMGFGFRRPKNPVPGLDVAGRVVEVGDDVTRFQPGDEVFGIANGSYAEYVAADAHKLAHKPTNLTFEEAAVAAVSGITALQAVSKMGRVREGQNVLILGASGGVGTYAVQLAKAYGARVTGVASTSKLELVRSLGASQVIDYTRDDLAVHGSDYDVIIDIGGRNRISLLRSLLAEKGTLVMVGGEGGGSLTGGLGRQIGASLFSAFVPQRLTMFISEEHHSWMEQLAARFQADPVRPVVGARYRLEEVPEAVRQLEEGRARGKTVIVVREE